MEVLLVIGIFWILPIFVGAAIGKPKNRAGGWWAFFLGWIGVIIVALLPPGSPMTLEDLEKKRNVVSPQYYEKKRAELVGALATRTHRECPHCKEEMRRDASVCPHCQRESAAWTLHEDRWWAVASARPIVPIATRASHPNSHAEGSKTTVGAFAITTTTSIEHDPNASLRPCP